MPQGDIQDGAAISAIISDLDGVVYRGDHPIADSIAAFRTWHARGVPYVFVTNDSAKSAAQFAAKLERMGVAATPEQVLNTVAATAALMRRHWPAGARVFTIGEPALLEALEEGGFRFAGEDADIVVLGFDYGLTYVKLRTAVRAALAGATVIVTNPDVLTPADNGFDPSVGTLAAAVAAAVPAAKPIVVGKPHPFMIEQALARIGAKRAEAVMIGDQIETDIAAGRRAGLRSILLTNGLPYRAVAGIAPDRIVSSLLELVDLPAGTPL